MPKYECPNQSEVKMKLFRCAWCIAALDTDGSFDHKEGEERHVSTFYEQIGKD